MKIQAARERNKNIRRLFTLFNISGEKKQERIEKCKQVKTIEIDVMLKFSLIK